MLYAQDVWQNEVTEKYMVSSPTLSGYTGMVVTPTAEMQMDRTIRFGMGHYPKEYALIKTAGLSNQVYYSTLSFLPFLEVSAGLLRQPSPQTIALGDRFALARLRILNEKKYLPAIVVGIHDPYGQTRAGDIKTNKHNATYLVATKHLPLTSISSVLTLNLGYGVDWVNSRFRTLVGVFSGLAVHHIHNEKQYSMMIEYDAKQFNIGLKAVLHKHFTIHVAVMDMKAIAPGLSYHWLL